MDESILNSEIFFFITTISTIVLTVLLAVALIYGIKVLQDLKYIVRKVKEEGDLILQDAREVRTAIKEKSGNLFSMIMAFFALKNRRKTKSSSNKNND